MDTSTTKDKQTRFGRTLALLFNRSLMYQKNHPMVQNAIEETYKAAQLIFQIVSPVVFILNRGLFFVDEEPLDPRINVKRIAHVFKTHGIQSISFEAGLTTGELDIFIDIFSAMTSDTNAESIKTDLLRKGAYNLKVNHVLYKKVTEDDQIVSREALKQVTPTMDEDDGESRKKFMDTLLETVLTDEFANTLNIKSLLDNPTLVSKTMIEADLASVDKFGQDVVDAGASGPPSTGSATTGSGSAAGYGGDTFGGEGTAALGSGTGTAGKVSESAPDDGVESADDHGAVAPGTGQTTMPEGSAATSDAGPKVVGAVDTIASGSGTGTAPTGAGAGQAGPDIGPSATAAEQLQPTRASTDGAGTHGNMLLHQLDLMQQEVQRHLAQGGEFSLEALANAVFEMKKQLFEDIQTQKALGIAYANEDTIVENINQLTDDVILKLIEEEYNDGKISTQRFAQIILRLIPDAKELRRLLPKIKDLLLECGMSPEAYLELIEELKHELQNEDLSRILEESSEAIGVDSEDLIEEIKGDPGQAAKLIYLASEIRKGGGDETALADILIDYVEQMTRKAAQDSEGDGGKEHLKRVVTSVESTLLNQLARMDVSQDVLLRMEERVNDRMDAILDRMRVEWLQDKASATKTEKTKPLTVLQTLEHNVGGDEEMAEILKTVRTKVDEGKIEENNFSQIYSEIVELRKQRETQFKGGDITEGILSRDEVMFILEKEIARANRYQAPFSALAFSFVDAKPKMKALEKLITDELIMAAALDKLVNTIREVDYIGQIGNNKMVALLPMQPLAEGKLALARITNLLNSSTLLVNEVPVQLHTAGVVVEYDSEQAPDALIFAKQLSNQLMDMVSRVKNIRVLF